MGCIFICKKKEKSIRFTYLNQLIVKIKKYKFQCSVNRKVKVKSLSCVQFFATPWTVACQASLSMGFSRQEYWSGMPFPSPSPYLFLFMKFCLQKAVQKFLFCTYQSSFIKLIYMSKEVSQFRKKLVSGF